MTDTKVTLDIVAKDSASAAFNKVAASVGHLGKEAETHGHKLTQLAEGIGAAFVVDKIKDFFVEGVKGASDLSEAQNKLNVLFGSGGSNSIQRWASTAATSLGQTKIQAEDAAATFGVFAKAAGLSGTQAVGFSEQMVQLATDMASFNNTSPEQALEAISAALRGESEPIRAYGVLLDDATLRQKAMQLGIISTTKNALTPQQRVLAAQAVIMQQTSAAQGDFARTSGGLANQQRILSASVENLKTSMGESLLPAVNATLKGLNGMLGVLNGMPAPLQSTVVTIGLFGVGAVAAGVAISRLKSYVTEAKESFTQLRTKVSESDSALSKSAATIGIVGAALAALAVVGASVGRTAEGINTVSKALQDYAKSGATTSEVTDNLAKDFSNLDRNGMQGAINSADRFLESMTGLVGLDDVGPSLHNSATRIKEIDQSLASLVSSGNTAQAQSQFDAIAAAAKRQGYSIEDLKKTFPQYNDALVGTKLGAQGAGQGMQEATTKSQALKTAMDALSASLDASNNKFLAGRSVLAAYWAAVGTATTAVKENGRTLDVHTEKGRANQAALDGQAKAALDYMKSLNDNKVPAAQFAATLASTRSALVTAAQSFGMTKAQAKAYADQILAIPKTVTTNAVANTAAAMSRLQALQDKLRAVNGVLTVTPSTGTYGQGLGVLRSSGGIIPGAPSTADTVPAMLAKGEFVVNSKATSKYLPLLTSINGGKSFAPGDMAAGAGAYSQAPALSSLQSSGGDTYLTVNVGNAVIGSEQQTAKYIISTIRSAVESGTLKFPTTR